MTAYTERQPAPAGKPPGAVTFLVADIDPAAHPVWPGDAPALLHAAVDAAAAAHGGRRAPGRPGEGLVAIFRSAADAVEAAVTLQRSAEPDFARQVRVALHTGEARLRDDGRYTGATLRRGQRLRTSETAARR